MCAGAMVIDSHGHMSVPDDTNDTDGSPTVSGGRPGPDMHGRYSAPTHKAEAGGVYSKG
jgi:hypothetical protein